MIMLEIMICDYLYIIKLLNIKVTINVKYHIIFVKIFFF